MLAEIVSDNEKICRQLGTVFLVGITLDFLALLADLTLIRQLSLLNPTCFELWFHFPGVLNCGLNFRFLGVGSSGCCDAICHPQTGLPS